MMNKKKTIPALALLGLGACQVGDAPGIGSITQEDTARLENFEIKASQQYGKRCTEELAPCDIVGRLLVTWEGSTPPAVELAVAGPEGYEAKEPVSIGDEVKESPALLQLHLTGQPEGLYTYQITLQAAGRRAGAEGADSRESGEDLYSTSAEAAPVYGDFTIEYGSSPFLELREFETERECTYSNFDLSSTDDGCLPHQVCRPDDGDPTSGAKAGHCFDRLWTTLGACTEITVGATCNRRPDCSWDEPGGSGCHESDSLRLDGSRLEVFHSGTWGAVCDDSFDAYDAVVACRQLGYATGTFAGKTNKPAGQKYWLDELKCKGTEEKLADCPHDGWGRSDCLGTEAVTLNCR